MLATKLFAPTQRGRLVARPRLLTELDGTLDEGHRLTLVSAPAGFGKTTLLSGWLAQLGERRPPTAVAWVSLDEGDNDVGRLLAHTCRRAAGRRLAIERRGAGPAARRPGGGR